MKLYQDGAGGFTPSDSNGLFYGIEFLFILLTGIHFDWQGLVLYVVQAMQTHV